MQRCGLQDAGLNPLFRTKLTQGPENRAFLSYTLDLANRWLTSHKTCGGARRGSGAPTGCARKATENWRAIRDEFRNWLLQAA